MFILLLLLEKKSFKWKFFWKFISYLHQTDPTINTVNFREISGMKQDYFSILQQISNGSFIELKGLMSDKMWQNLCQCFFSKSSQIMTTKIEVLTTGEKRVWEATSLVDLVNLKYLMQKEQLMHKWRCNHLPSSEVVFRSFFISILFNSFCTLMTIHLRELVIRRMAESVLLFRKRLSMIALCMLPKSSDNER